MKKILLTGATGFIGRNILQELLKEKKEITVIIRPGTSEKLINNEDVEIIEIDLTDILRLKKYLSENKFDCIYHIGAIRGGRKFSQKKYFDANVKATEQLAIAALENGSKLVFCSSVGIFGAIPNELPANNFTETQTDNFYHYTKIEAEKIIQKYVLSGLNAVIIRPAITYGIGDYGFPFTLTKLVEKKMLFLPNKTVRIHLTNVEILVEAFIKAMTSEIKPGSAFNVADSKPVQLSELADFISKNIHEKGYPKSRIIDEKYFRIGERIAIAMKNELWTARFQLISKSWYYDIENTKEMLKLRDSETIPNFKVVVDWYKEMYIKNGNSDS